MSLERPTVVDKNIENNPEKIWKRKDKSSKRLITALEVFTKVAVREVKVDGLEHVLEIPSDRKVVIAVSHASDLDLPLAAGLLSKYFDVIITNQSIQYKFSQDMGSNVGMKVLGTGNFLPIDWELPASGKPRKFNPENFKPMADAMQDGRSIIIAGHQPSHQGVVERSGYGAVYLSEITNAVVLPVGVDVKSDEGTKVGMSDHKIKTLLQRPAADIKIGPSFELQHIEGLDRLAEIIEKRKKGVTIDKQELQEFDSLKEQLKIQSRILIDKIVELMPSEKQPKEENHE